MCYKAPLEPWSNFRNASWEIYDDLLKIFWMNNAELPWEKIGIFTPTDSPKVHITRLLTFELPILLYSNAVMNQKIPNKHTIFLHQFIIHVQTFDLTTPGNLTNYFAIMRKPLSLHPKNCCNDIDLLKSKGMHHWPSER